MTAAAFSLRVTVSGFGEVFVDWLIQLVSQILAAGDLAYAERVED
ncbi:MAG: hypothetical protein AB4038_02810 [Prochloraceae cyanobacterium]